MDRRQDLLQRLAGYGPAEEAEAQFVTRMRRLLASPGDPFSRRHLDPGHFTASAFIVSPGARILLIRHPKLDRWLQPGGHVEPGDRDIRGAAMREATEESGIPDLAIAQDGILDVDIHRIPARPGEPEHEHFDVRFLLDADAEDPAPGGLPARWVAPSDLPLLSPEPAMRRVAAKLLARA